MKTSILAGSMVAAIGLSSAVGAGTHHEAHAAEQSQINKTELAQKAQANDPSLESKPIQSGSYDYNFTVDGLSYHFWSDGNKFGYEYEETTSNSMVSHQSNEQTQSYNQENEVQQPKQPKQQTQSNNVEQQQQPKTQATPQTQETSNDSSNEASKSSSGVNAHLQQIAQRESGGDIHAINPSTGAAGKYQFLQSTWDSVAPSEYQGVSPTEAPEAVQDAAAVKLYNTAGASQWVTA